MRILNEESFFPCQKLSSQVYLVLVPCFLKNIYSYPFHSGLFQKKIQTGGLRIHFFENRPGIFHFFTIPLEIPDKRKFNPWIIHKIVLDSLEIPRPKTTTPGNSTLFFLVTLGNSTSFLLNPWKFRMLFLWYPLKSHILNLRFNFFWDSPISSR